MANRRGVARHARPFTEISFPSGVHSRSIFDNDEADITSQDQSSRWPRMPPSQGAGRDIVIR